MRVCVCLYESVYVRRCFSVAVFLQAPAGMTSKHMYSSSSPHLAMGCGDPAIGSKVTNMLTNTLTNRLTNTLTNTLTNILT